MTDAPFTPQGFSHVRITVTDIDRSKAFYASLFGLEPAFDYSDQGEDAKQDPKRLYGGAGFSFGGQLLGLRPVAKAGDRFDSTRVGLDHLSISVGSVQDLHDAAARLTEMGIEHGEVIDLGDLGMAILSIQDPDDVNIELAAPNS